MLEQLQVILEAEAEARRVLEGAAEEARRCTKRAEEEGRVALRRAQLERDTIAQAAEEDLVHAATERAHDDREEARAKVARMRTSAEARIQRAVDRMVACVLGAGVADAH